MSDSSQNPEQVYNHHDTRIGDDEDPHPVYCVWEITLECDLGCRHCGSRAGQARPDELNTDECLEVVEQLAELGVREVTLIGGEAYLRDDWDTIAAEIDRQGMVCGMTTGARNLTDERIDEAIEAGLQTISISIDGLEQTHDALRGARGAWEAATDAARRVADSPINLGTNSQINRLSMPELPALADLLVDIGTEAWQIQLTVPMGRAADRPEVLLQPHDLLDLFPMLVWIKQTKLQPNDIRLQPGNNIGYFGPYEHLLRPGGEKGAVWGGCKAGTWTLGLEADGKIKGCPSLPSTDYTGGNVREMTIAEAVEHTEQLNSIGERTREDLWGYCADCYYGDHCLGGCTWTADCLMGQPGNNPYCIHRALQFESEGKRERLVKAEDAPGDPFDSGRFELVVEPDPNTRTEALDSVLGISAEEVTGLDAGEADSAWDLRHIAEVLQEG